jgi:hypothetical protein
VTSDQRHDQAGGDTSRKDTDRQSDERRSDKSGDSKREGRERSGSSDTQDESNRRERDDLRRPKRDDGVSARGGASGNASTKELPGLSETLEDKLKREEAERKKRPSETEAYSRKMRASM